MYENLKSRIELLVSTLEWYANGGSDAGSLARNTLKTEVEQKRRAVTKLTPVNFNEAIEILNSKRRETKKNAIDIATESFVMNYSKGIFENNDELMYHVIENINSLIVELNRTCQKDLISQ